MLKAIHSLSVQGDRKTANSFPSNQYIGAITIVLGILFQLIGLCTPNWSRDPVSNNDHGPLTFGLWKYCYEKSIDDCEYLEDNHKSGYLMMVRVLAVLSILPSLASLSQVIKYLRKPGPDADYCELKLTLAACSISLVLVLMSASIYNVSVPPFDGAVGYSLVTIVLGVFTICFGGLVFSEPLLIHPASIRKWARSYGFQIGTVCLVFGLSLQIGGLVTQYWSVVGIKTFASTHEAKFGLWQQCTDIGCREIPKELKTDSMRAAGVYAMLAMSAGVLAAFLALIDMSLETVNSTQSSKLQAVIMLVCIMDVLLVITTSSVYLVCVHPLLDETFSITLKTPFLPANSASLNVGLSFAFHLIGGIMVFVGGLIFYLAGFREGNKKKIFI